MNPLNRLQFPRQSPGTTPRRRLRTFAEPLRFPQTAAPIDLDLHGMPQLWDSHLLDRLETPLTRFHD